MIKGMVQSCFLLFIVEMHAFAIEAPPLTDEDFLAKAFLNKEKWMPISINDGQVEAEFVQEIDVVQWAQGRKLFDVYFLTPLLTKQRQPSPAQILNQDQQFVEVTAENSGQGNFFLKLGEAHYGKMACKYQYTIPHIASRSLLNDFRVSTHYPAVPKTDFIVYLIADREDLLNPAKEEDTHELVTVPPPYHHVVSSPTPITTTHPVVAPTPQPIVAPVVAPTPQPTSVVSLQPVVNHNLDVRMHKGKRWFFKGGVPVNPC